MALNLKIVSPEKIVYSGATERVIVPGTAGQFEILDQHAPIISSLTAGEVRYVADGQDHTIEVKGGFVSVKKNQVNVCVEV